MPHTMNSDTSIYLHIPFCKHRCAYCDFNTYAGQEDLIPAYVEALMREIEFVGDRLESGSESGFEKSIHTVFFGGGTPSLLSGSHLASIMEALHTVFVFTPDLEATLEANPGTTSLDFLHQIHTAGLNRLSFGVQSASPEELHLLERAHDFFDVIQSVKWARQAGFANLNLDLIYGLPEQRLERWQDTVRRIVDLGPEHISAYALTVEHGTPFGRWSTKGLLPAPDPDAAADMYEWASDFLESAGYVQYEISNWAKSGHACRHNLQYWRGLPYLALGAGAHGYAGGHRYSNVLRIGTYIDRLRDIGSRDSNLPFPLTPAAVNHHRQTPQDDMSEFMMTGLRLTQEGVSTVQFETRFGTRLEDVYGREVDELMRLDLLEWQAECIRLTRRGRLLGNQVFMRFVEG